MTVTVKVEGLSELVSALQELPKATAKNTMKRILVARAKSIADDAVGLCPVHYGDLKKSITVSTKLSKRQRKDARETKSYVEVYVGPGPLPQAHMVEFGSIHNPHPKPFMRPAWDSNKGQLLTNIRDDLWKEIQAAAARLARKAARAKG